MSIQEIKFKGTKKYSVVIGRNTLKTLFKKVKTLCPRAQKVALIIDNNVPKNFKIGLSKKFKHFDLLIYHFNSNEKHKSLVKVNKLLNKLFMKNFNKSDLIISVGGGIAGDLTGFVASIYKRGINFINIPTTLLAQVDSAIGGKTGVNSSYGKNLIGSFNQPKLVIIDVSFLKSLPKKEMICGFAEILKHAIIKDRKFFNWLKINSKKILKKNTNALVYAIKRSCEIKMFFINKDVNEKNIRMKLNFGHTFAHAIEVRNNYSKKNTHGEAVLSGMILATKLSVIKKICKPKVLDEIKKIYEKNNLAYTYNKFSKRKSIESLIPYLKHDKKNNDSKINFILLKNIGKTTEPNKNKISTIKLKKLTDKIIQC